MALELPKLTIFFAGTRGEGWTESWYPPGGDDYPAYVTLLNQYISRRRNALGGGANIVYGRVSDDKVARDSSAVQVNLADGSSIVSGIAGKEAGFGSDCVIFRCEGGPLHRKSWMVRGLDDADIDRSFANGYNPAGRSLNALNDLIVWMLGKSFGFRIRTAVGPPPVYGRITCTKIFPVRWSTRRVGRPFGQPVGRRLPR